MSFRLPALSSRTVVSSVVLLLLGAVPLRAQTLLVVDATTGAPLPAVQVRGTAAAPTHTTDLRGRAHAPPGDTLHLRAAGYQPQHLARTTLAAAHWRVALLPLQYDADEVVITASRWAEPRQDMPQHLVRITSADIAFRNPPTTADALAQSGEIFVQKSQQGGGSPMLRGFSANAVLLVLDGVRLNNAIYRSGNLQNSIMLDANALGSIEVLQGPGSVQYGSDALGGVLHFRTQPLLFSDSNIVVRGTAMARYASANHEQTSHLGLHLAGRRLALYFAATHSDFANLRTGGWRTGAYPDFGRQALYVERSDGTDSIRANPDPNTIRPSGYWQLNTLAKLRWQPVRSLDLLYGFYYTNSGNIPRTDRLLETNAAGQPVFAEWAYGPQQWRMHSLTASLAPAAPPAVFDDLRLTAAYQALEESRIDRRVHNPSRRTQLEGVSATSLNLDARKRLHRRHELYYGLELVWNHVRSTAYRTNIVTGTSSTSGTRYPDSNNTVHSAAAYVQYAYKPSPRLTLLAGARYTDYQLDSRNRSGTNVFQQEALRIRATAWSGTLGAVVHAGHGWHLTANAASGFRAPNLDDVGKLFEFADGNLTVPNAGLAPEYAYTLESGLEKRWGDRLRLALRPYATWVSDAIERRPFQFNGQTQVLLDGALTNVFANVNAGTAWVYGATLHLQAAPADSWHFTAHLTYTEGETRDGVPLRHVPPLFGQAMAQYRPTLRRLGRIQTEAQLQFSGPKPFSDLPPGEQAKLGVNYSPNGVRGWWVANLRASVPLSQVLQVQAALENVFDRHYRTFASGIPAPGRNLVLALRAHW